MPSMGAPTYVSGMNETPRRLSISDTGKRSANTRWNPDRRAANIIAKIEQMIEAAQADFDDNPNSDVVFTDYFAERDRVRIYKLMGGQPKKKG